MFSLQTQGEKYYRLSLVYGIYIFLNDMKVKGRPFGKRKESSGRGGGTREGNGDEYDQNTL
jgi:hypothetical protein